MVSEPVWWRASFPVARGEPSEVVLGKAEGGGPALSGFCPFSQNLEVRDDSLRAQHLRQPALRRHRLTPVMIMMMMIPAVRVEGGAAGRERRAGRQGAPA